MVKYFLVTILIFCASLDKSAFSLNAQSDTSATEPPAEEKSSTDSVSDEVDRRNTTDDCSYNVNKTGELKVFKGTLKPLENCVWNITRNTNMTGMSNGLLFTEVHLDDNDNLTIHLADDNETLIFGPYHGILGPLVIAVDEDNFIVKVSTSASKMLRIFQVLYNELCIFAIPPSIEIIESPVYLVKPGQVNCVYDYNKIHGEIKYSFVFHNFSLDSLSNLHVTNTEQDEMYQITPPDIFGSLARFNMTLNANSSSNKFTIVRRDLNAECSGFVKDGTSVPVLRSPPAVKAYNTSVNFECRWLIKTESDKTLRLLVDQIQFNSVLDTLIVNDGPSELSAPIAQVCRVNQNQTLAQMIRTSGSYMWISFRSEAFASKFVGNFTSGKGGYNFGSGKISIPSDVDSVILLEVEAGEKVLLNFSLAGFSNPATINIYDGFGVTPNPIAQLNGTIWYPVVSSSSKMMVASSHGTQGSAEFRGIKSDCIHMSESSSDAYILSGNCNSTCSWVVPPNNASAEVLLLEFQLISLDADDVVEIFRLGNSNVSAVKIVEGIQHVPPLAFSPKEGYYVKISRGNCNKKGADSIALIARATFLPGCSGDLSLNPSVELQLSSPNYPNLYPLFTNCRWNLTASGSTTQFYASFIDMKLAPNHCIRIANGNGSVVRVFSGNELPDDMLLPGNSVIRFDSFNCNTSAAHASLVSNEGFVLNVTSSDCGGTLTEKTGKFNTSLTITKENRTCFWIIEVPPKEGADSNSIMFTVEEIGKGSNSEFHVYDGPSVRDPVMNNFTQKLWSRYNTVIFMYKRLDSSSSSTVYTVSYETISCNKTMQCENGICLHPDWLCNGHNDCGDFTDEKNCETVPVPDSIKQAAGVSPLAFGLVTVLFFCLGALAAFLIPKAIARYRTGRYHHFQDYTGND